ncbi:MAG: glycosyltransferase [candidate division WOR-3 bacterium]
MRIAIFHNLPSGGSKRALYGFVKYLKIKNYSMDLFLPETANEDFLPLKDYVNKLRIFPVKRSPAGMFKSFCCYLPPLKFSLADIEDAQKKIAQAIEQDDYEVIYVDQDRFTNSPFLLKFVNKPSVYYCAQPSRKSEMEILRKNLFKITNQGLFEKLRKCWQAYAGNRLEKIDIENASHARYLLTNSFFSHENIMRVYGINSYVCYLGVDTEFFKPLDLPKNHFVLSVGECAFHKGYDFIIRALGLIDPRIRPKFLIVANNVDPAWKSFLYTLAQAHEVELVVKQNISDHELLELYNQTKMIVYAPYLEPFGLVPLEAMACATPVVAVKEGGVRESVIHNETGILTERDEIHFAEAIRELLGDQKRQSQLGKRGRAWVHSSWTLRHAGERLIAHLNRAVANSAPGGTC